MAMLEAAGVRLVSTVLVGAAVPVMQQGQAQRRVIMALAAVEQVAMQMSPVEMGQTDMFSYRGLDDAAQRAGIYI